MNSKARDFNKAEPADVADLNTDNTAATNPAAAVRYVAGTRMVAVTWISRVYNLRAVPAPASTPAKK